MRTLLLTLTLIFCTSGCNVEETAKKIADTTGSIQIAVDNPAAKAVTTATGTEPYRIALSQLLAAVGAIATAVATWQARKNAKKAAEVKVERLELIKVIDDQATVQRAFDSAAKINEGKAPSGEKV